MISAAYLVIVGFLAVNFLTDNRDISPPKEHPPREFVTKYSVYLPLSLSVTKQTAGWIELDHCDATLFSGLRGTFCTVDLERGLLSPGEWTRKDLSVGACYPNGSGSQISRDMLLGVAYWAWRNRRPDVARDVLAYYAAHGGWMGPGDSARTNLRHQLRDTFRLVAGEKVSNPEPIILTGFETGYERHLGAVHLLLRSEILGHVSNWHGLWALWMARSEPHNPLYELIVARFVSGDYRRFYALMTNRDFWPEKTLPKFCIEWVIQTDAESGHWGKRCEKGTSGSEWLFLAQFGFVPFF